LGAGGAVSVTVERRSSQEAAIEIMDTGKGMSPDDLRRLGESFFTRRAGGVGLGFALARKIVQEHGGRLEVVSRERAGTTVTVLIPIESVHQTAHPEMPAAGVMRG
jgi:signal transduction histidine kinase